jgi:predicted extracellular nuclease/2',3'-cyclic-nucleotide 2'-phosphodiesterase (5'-nucleotidase family)
MRTPALPSPRRIAAGAGLALLAAGLTPIAASPANADVATKIATFPYSQDWSTASLITTNDNWSGVTGVQGYLGQDITTSSAGADPQTLLTESAIANDTDVIANQAAPNTNTAGGVAEFDGIADPSIALQGSGTADAPYVAFHLDLAGQTNVTFAFNARDLDGSADNAVQQVAVQYRVGATGNYTNLPDGYIADATTGGSATQVTARSVTLPAAVDNQASVFVRVITSNASGSDEWVGIDDVAISAEGGTSALAVTNPGPQNSVVGTPIDTLTLSAGGGTGPYTFGATNLPAGLSLDTDSGAITGTPTTAGAPTVEVSVTDADAATDTESFVWTVTEPAAPVAIAAIQGTGSTTPVSGDDVATQGVVTASYPTGGLNGFYIQTPGADTPDASDAIFVYGGPGGFATYPAVGDSVEVTGVAGEFGGQTQINASAGSVTPVAALGDVTPKTTIPGTTCELPGATCDTVANLAPAREAMEGELLEPTADFTVTDSYDGSPFWAGNSFSSGMFGEIGLAAATDKPLVTPTELYDAQNEKTLIAQRTAYNNARRIILDDGSSANYAVTGANTGQPFPWLTADHSVRVGAAVTFPEPVVFTEGFNTWRLLPTTRVVGEPSATQPQIEQTRADNLAPQEVGGDVKLATFNVLNFFPTTGEEFVASGLGTCTYYRDRAGNNITNNRCDPNGPRGAANEANLVRQRDKIVAAINTVGADIVSLEELENSAKFGKNRDFAINALVEALNADAGAGTWAAVPSPATLPPLAEQDVIRNGFIYRPANVRLVGDSVVLSDQSSSGEAFEDAREPLAQAFKQVGTPNSRGFAVIVNHFKSKGSGTPDPDGQGNANDARILQAEALATFADEFKTARGISRVFLAGDFNAYSEEDPIQVLEEAGYTSLESSSNPDEESYNFDGMVGSLDHVLANDAALADVDGVDIWDINASESVYYEYARFNSNVTNLYTDGPFRSSDHNPEIIGINTAGLTDVQIIGSNDYHGRLAAGPRLAAYVKAARQANPNTVFAAAGDLVGATTFESFIQHDKPTIDVMNEAGLDVSAVGNHEFDAGYDDLVNRIMAPYDADTNPEGGAEWQYLGANVKFKADGSDALEGTWIQDFGDVEVGFVGAVTEDLPSLVAADGIADIEVTDIVEATNEAATELKGAGADVVVLLVHEGAGGTSYASATTPGTAFGDIVNGVSPDVDAIVSGHTHLAYNHSVPVPAWVAEERAVTERPVVSAGQYGENLNKLVFTVDNATGEVQAKTQEIVPFASFPATGDAATQAIVNDANAKAAVLGAQPLGKIEAGFSRAKFVGGAENRGGESTLNNLVAEVQRWSTDADIAFMNPGGLRADMPGTGTDYPRTVTYKNAADVQPFANTLLTMGLTGSSIKKVLEQQWQRTAGGTVPSRPFLKLGVSNGFEYTYDPTRAEGDRITGMWLDGEAIDAGTTYQVAANAFLASGTGDNFFAFSEATGKRDSGKVDLAAMVDYMATFATEADPLGVDYSQRAIGVAGVANEYAPGQAVTVNLTSLAMTGVGDLQDTAVEATFNGQPIGEFAVDNTANPAGDANSNDEAGKATVTFTVPAGTATGTYDLVVTGATTGTSTTIAVPVKAAVQQPVKADTTVTGTAGPVTYGTAGSVAVKVAPAAATGTVAVSKGNVVLGSVVLASGQGTVTLPAKSLPVGSHTLTLTYSGDTGHKPSTGSVTVVVVKAEAILKATVKPKRVVADKTRARVVVTVAAEGYVPTGRVKVRVAGKTYRAKLVDGKAVIKLKEFEKPRLYTAKVSYLGDDNTESARTAVKIRVKRR